MPCGVMNQLFSGNVLLPDQHKAIMWHNTDFLSVMKDKWKYDRNVYVSDFDLEYQRNPFFATTDFFIGLSEFLEHSPEKKTHVMCKIPLAQAKFLLPQLKMHSHCQAGRVSFPHCVF